MLDTLSRIERAALNDDLGRALRLCLKLGVTSKCPELSTWAKTELEGYRTEAVPPYRQRMVTPRLTVRNSSGRATNFPLMDMGAMLALKEHNVDPRRVKIRLPILELQEWAASEKEMSLTHDDPELVLHLLNEALAVGVIDTISWPASPSSLAGISKHVATVAYELALEAKAERAWHQRTPPPSRLLEILMRILGACTTD